METLLSAQYFYKPTTALKIKSINNIYTWNTLKNETSGLERDRNLFKNAKTKKPKGISKLVE